MSTHLENMQMQLTGLRKLLAVAGDDPVMVPQLTARIAGFERAIAEYAPPAEQAPTPAIPKIKIVIVVEGGVVQDVFSTTPDIDVEIVDNDEGDSADNADDDPFVVHYREVIEQIDAGAYPYELLSGEPVHNEQEKSIRGGPAGLAAT